MAVTKPQASHAQGPLGMGAPAPAAPRPDTGLTDFLNTTNTYGVAGTYQAPSGATYSTPGSGGGGGSAPRGASGGSAAAAVGPGGTSDTFDSDMARISRYLPTASPMPSVPMTGPVDSSAAESAAFARAKDRSALGARSALDSLHEQLAANGLSGSSIEGTGTANVIDNAINQTDEVARGQAEQSAQRAGQVADRNYSGAITQRGQDLAAGSARVNQMSALMALLQRSRSALY
jgi:hypothetical protein